MKLLLLLLTLFIFKGIFQVLLIPLWQAPDEPNHFAYTQFLAETGKFVVGRLDNNLSAEVAQSAALVNLDLTGQHPLWRPDFSENFNGKFEKEIVQIPREARNEFIGRAGGGRSPPLYYLATSVIYRIFSTFSLIDRVFILRLFSVILGAGVVVLTYLLAKELFNKNEKIGLICATITAFHPSFNVLSSTLNPDILLIFATSAFLFFGVKILKNAQKFFELFLFLASLLGGVLTRFAGIALIPLGIIPLISERLFLVNLIVILFLASFLVRLISPGLVSEFFGFFANPVNLTPASFFNFAVNSFTHYNSEVFSWYWAVFGWLEAALPINVYRVLRVLSLLSVLGLIMPFVTWLKRIKFDRNFWIWFFLVATVFLTTGFIVLFDWQTYTRTGVGFGVQGRHFLTAISAQMIFFVVGVGALFEKLRISKKNIFLSLTFWFIALNFLSIWVMANFFYQTNNLQELIIRASQYKPMIAKGTFLIFWFLIFGFFQIIFFVKLLDQFLIKNEK